MSDLVYNDIPSKAFIPVIRRTDIVKARPMNKDERKQYDRGGPDILLLTPTGEQRAITRKELMSNYSYLNGKKITITGWTSKSTYTVAKMDNSTLYAMLIPENCTVSILGKLANKNRNRRDYIICGTDASGDIDRDNVGVLSNSLFRKMFQIPQHDVIARNLGKGNKTFDISNVKRNRGQVKSKPVNTSKAMDFGLNTNEFNDLAQEIQQQPVKKVGTNMNIVKNDETIKKLTAVGRLMRNGSIEGFVVQNNKGETRNVTKKEMMMLCNKKLVDNIMLSTNENTGKYYLRGNGIRIEMLQPYDI